MFGKRSDGRKLKNIPTFFRVIPSIMLDRADSQVYFKQDIIKNFRWGGKKKNKIRLL